MGACIAANAASAAKHHCNASEQLFAARNNDRPRLKTVKKTSILALGGIAEAMP